MASSLPQPRTGARRPPIFKPTVTTPPAATAARAPASEAKDTPLFREEVLKEQRTQWLGTVLLEPRVSHTVFTAVAVCIGFAIVLLLTFGSYTRKAHVTGWLVPQQGLARIVAPQIGVVTTVHVHEGMIVTKGAPLVTLSGEIQSEARGATKEEVVRKLQDRRDSMTNARQVAERQFEQEAAETAGRLDVLRSRLALNERALARDRMMRARDLIPLPRLQRTEQEYLDSKGSLLALEAAFRDLPFRKQTQLAQTEREIAALEQELAEAESKRQIVIVAPQDGVVSALQAERGSSVQPNVPLMSIIPAGTTLQAQLFGPSRAIGFLQQGQRVQIRYQAYPYQKYGSYAGSVASISRSAISPAELGPQFAGLTSIYGANEPLYRITVELERQSATAYGKPAPLQPGMQLDADIMIESRRLIEWVFDPLFTLTGKWQT